MTGNVPGRAELIARTGYYPGPIEGRDTLTPLRVMQAWLRLVRAKARAAGDLQKAEHGCRLGWVLKFTFYEFYAFGLAGGRVGCASRSGHWVHSPAESPVVT